MTHAKEGGDQQNQVLYGATRDSPKSFYSHHMQRLVKAAVVGDAENIRMQVNCHRLWLHHWASPQSHGEKQRIGIGPGETGGRTERVN